MPRKPNNRHCGENPVRGQCKSSLADLRLDIAKCYCNVFWETQIHFDLKIGYHY